MRSSELTFKDICDSNFGAFTKVFWNGKLIFDDEIQAEILFKNSDTDIVRMYDDKEIMTVGCRSLKTVLEKYADKKVYSFYCRIHSFHHTELFIEGER